MQDPQSLHKYAYVHGDPVQGVDPTGLFGGFSISGMLASVNIYAGAQQQDIARGTNGLRSANQVRKVVKQYNKVLRLLDKLEDVTSAARDIVDILSFDPADLADVIQQLGPVRSMFTNPDAIIGRPQVTIRLPRAALKAFHKISKRVAGPLASRGFGQQKVSTGVSEVMGELGTAFILAALKFEQTPFLWRWSAKNGPDQVAYHRKTGNWAVVEAKGGASELGNTAQWGKQMGKRWIEHWVQTIIDSNGDARAGQLKNDFNRRKSMIAAVVRVNIQPTRGEIKITIQNFKNGHRMHGWGDA